MPTIYPAMPTTELTRAAYPAELVQQAGGMWIWRYEPVLEGILADLRRGEAAGLMATRFHNSVCEALLALAKEARTATGLSTVALSGGVFCNRYLAERLIKRLKSAGFGVLWKRRVPANDGGVALGQAAIAAAMLENRNTGILPVKKQARPRRP